MDFPLPLGGPDEGHPRAGIQGVPCKQPKVAVSCKSFIEAPPFLPGRPGRTGPPVPAGPLRGAASWKRWAMARRKSPVRVSSSIRAQRAWLRVVLS